MNHEPEQLRLTIERYLLDEMSPEEETEWEIHYIGCPICLNALKEAKNLAHLLKTDKQISESLIQGIEGSKKPNELSPAKPDTGFHNISRLLLLAAGLCLILGIATVMGWMRTISLTKQVNNLLLPSIPQVSYTLHGPYRGPAEADESIRQEIQLPDNGGSFILHIPPLTASDPTSIYRAHILDSNDAVIWSSPDLSFQSTIRRFSITCESSFFTPGDYDLLIEEYLPDDEKKISEFSFPFRIIASSD